jgi:propionyl-CoA synthetase
MSYQDLYQQSIEQPEIFWRKQAELIKWYDFPETRSGKILRETIRKLAVETVVPVPPTIDDLVILDEIRDVMRERGIGQYAMS